MGAWETQDELMDRFDVLDDPLYDAGEVGRNLRIHGRYDRPLRAVPRDAAERIHELAETIGGKACTDR